MRNEKSLNVLTQEQKSKYLKEGYLGLSGLVSQRWLDRLRVVTESFVEESKALTESDKRFDLEPNHTAKEPRIRSCLLYTSPSPRDRQKSRMPSSA